MTLYPRLHQLIQRPLIWRVLLYPLLLIILFLATTSQTYPVPASASDKVNHIMAFLTLGVLMRLSYPQLGWKASLGWLLAYGLGIELIQALLPYRDFSLLDLVADGFGALSGLALGYGVLRGLDLAAPPPLERHK